ncbi:amino acid adenylation domain-containing protein [Auritidibacter ignavus]|uniref:non-ribosomal peptide synthetase n=1 Tax=Auritidibacter ignavus TaxID=678932 RepID=UPI00244B6320|nr:amino acid adenylation domain-containing protein [Auritidibacter ignavus]WGH81041.1 amino acid adenylation domain-containing protein [Auritidibacter ignavus]WGH90231.1 amino acid adenylation domain-containing protein [Auritidibacter ignavus]
MEHKMISLTAAQEEFWYSQVLSNGKDGRFVREFVDIFEDVDLPRMEESLRRVVLRTEALGLIIDIAEALPQQHLRSNVPNVHALDFSSSSDPEGAFDQWLAPWHERLTPLSSGYSHVFAVARMRDRHYRIDFAAHHYHLDGYAGALIVREVMNEYRGRATESSTESVARFGDLSGFIERDRQYRESNHLVRDREYWQNQAQRLGRRASLSSAPPSRATNNHIFRSTMSNDLFDELTRTGKSIPATLLAAAAVLLHPTVGDGDIPVGLALAARFSRKDRETPATAANILPVPIHTTAEMTFEEVVANAEVGLAGVLRHQRYRASRLSRDLRLESGVTEVAGLTVNYMGSFDSGLEGIKSRLTVVNNGLTDDAFVSVYHPEIGTTEALWYTNDQMHTESETQRQLQQFIRALVAVVDDPHQFVGNVDLAGDELRDQLESFNQTGTVAVPAVLPDLFAQQVALHSQRLAVSGADDGLTYEQLDRESNRVARYLIDLGVGPESIVAILLPRGVDALVSILGVIKAGGAYLPVDPEYPLERIDYILNDACPSFVVASSSRGSGRSGEILIEDRPWQAVSDRVVEQQDRVRALGVDDPAYLIYTSGSTGKPKGVLVTHRGLADLAGQQQRSLEVTPNSRVLQFASLSFDAAVYEVVMAWCSGACLISVGSADLVPGTTLAETVKREGVTHALLTPSVLKVCNPDDFTTLRFLAVGAEACSAELVQEWAPGRLMVNAYGPTEDTVNSTITGALVPGEDAPSIGRPFPGTSIYVLDGNLNPCPVGVTGELFIAGIGLARGYFRRPGLTAERFIADPFAGGGARMYRSGDLARWNEHGEVVFEGRNDDQVKIRGFRVETGEVEAALLRVPGVAQATVMVREDMPGHRQLVGYVVAGSDDVEPALVREQLRQWLPDYMVPAAVVELEKIPLTHNGKTDFRQLPRPELDDARLIVEPVSETERVLVQLYSEVLGLDSVSTDESFFALGGDSIMAIQLVNRIRARGLSVKPADVFSSPTVRDLSSRICEVDAEGANSPVELGSTTTNETSDRTQNEKVLVELNHSQMDSLVALYGGSTR